MAIATLCHHVRAVRCTTNGNPWKNEISDLLALAIDHVANRNSTLCHWDMGGETISSTFQRYALRVNWDFVEGNPAAGGSGSFISAVDSIALSLSLITQALSNSPAPKIVLGSATKRQASQAGKIDLILTDPPYYDAIPYADLSDFFYVWMRRMLGSEYAEVFRQKLTDKSNELIQHAARTDGDNEAAKSPLRGWYGRGL